MSWHRLKFTVCGKMTISSLHMSLCLIEHHSFSIMSIETHLKNCVVFNISNESHGKAVWGSIDFRVLLNSFWYLSLGESSISYFTMNLFIFSPAKYTPSPWRPIHWRHTTLCFKNMEFQSHSIRIHGAWGHNIRVVIWNTLIMMEDNCLNCINWVHVHYQVRCRCIHMCIFLEIKIRNIWWCYEFLCIR